MLRNLKTSDIFKISKILKKMNLKNELKVENGKTQQQIGAEFILTIFESLHLAEDEVNEFIGNLAGITKEEFSNLEIDKTLEYIEEFKNMKGISNFFKSASQLTKSK